MARHRASKLSESSGAHACESNGLLGFSGGTLARSSSDFGFAETRTGHSNDDFESIGLPSYQHFRPSIRRQDQYPCELDGLEPVHFCFACAAGISIDESVAMQTAKAINGICVFIMHLMQ
jgi:hypothetical protein